MTIAAVIFGALFVGYAAASILWSVGDILWPTIELTSIVMAFFLGLWVDAEQVWKVVHGFLAILLAVALVGFSPNPNLVAIGFTLALAAAIGYELWVLLPLDILGLWYFNSRTAFLAAGIVILIALIRRRPLWALAITASFALLFFIKPTGDTSFFIRLGIWQDTINHFTFFGHGFGSFPTAYLDWQPHKNVTFFMPTHAYNDIIELISDLGIGSIFFWFFLAACYDEGYYPTRLILLAFFVVSLAYFPIWIPIIGQLLAFTLGSNFPTPQVKLWHAGESKLSTI